jgi:hypothetical protein
MYNYLNEKQGIFTEEGQVMFLQIRDNVQRLLKTSGAFTMGNAISGVCGSSWMMMACVDRMIELKEIREITDKGVAGQYRVFVASNN